MGGPLLVLVIDDYRDTLDLASVLFEAAGYDVLLADNARDGIALARQHRPVAIVMDIFMPEMDGIEATRIIKADPVLADTPVVAHTARPWGLEGAEDLFESLCAKPCTPENLLRLVEGAIARRAARRRGP